LPNATGRTRPVTKTVGGARYFAGMTIIEEHRTEVRVGTSSYHIQVAAQPSDDRSAPGRRVTVTLSGAGPQGEILVEGHLDVVAEAVPTVAEVLADTLCTFAGVGRPQRRRPGARLAQQGRPWTEELDAELESRWQAGESVEEIARSFERSPGGIRARLPRVGCDPENPGAYLPTPPSRRAEATGGDGY